MLKLIEKSKNSYSSRIIAYEIDEDKTNLTGLLANFVEMTEKMGYQGQSWNNLIQELNNIGLNENYTLFDWALDIRY